MTEIGAKIRSMREAKGLSVRGLAERSGVSPSYVSKIENGQKNNLSADVLFKLAKGLQCHYWLLLAEAGQETDSRDKLIEELVSLNLWSARRLPTVHKEFAYGMLDELVTKKYERL